MLMPETTAKGPKKPKKQPSEQGATITVPKKKTGRPSKYTPELAAEMCERLSAGEPLRQICRDDHMPHWTQVYEWKARDEELSLRVAHAREAGYDAIAEELLEISDTMHFGETIVQSDNKITTTTEDMLGHRKLRIETRMKLLACWSPAKYGNKVQVGGDKDNPLQVEASAEANAMLAALIKNAELKRQADE